MRPTKLVADSTEGLVDAVRKLIDKTRSVSENIKSIRIVEDIGTLPGNESKFRLKAHVLKRV